MAGFTKLDSGLIDSSIWCEPDDVLRVWIALLAKSDARGYCRVAPPAMARLCMMPLERYQEIIEKLASPDPYSRTPEEDGKRIRIVEGGYELVNYEKYRLMWSNEDRREYKRRWDRENRPDRSKYMQAWRRKKNRHVTDSDRHSPTEPKQAEAEAEANTLESVVTLEEKFKIEPVPTIGQKSQKARSLTPDMSNGFSEFWSAYPRKHGKHAALKAWKKIEPGKKLAQSITEAVEKQKAARHWRGNDGKDYIPNPATWLNQGRWEDEISRQQTSEERIAEIRRQCEEEE